jgi:hypothetical protein
MEDYPRTLAEVEARFSTEEACREYLFRLRWPDGFRCPRCSGAKAWPVRKTLYQCSICGYQISVIAGTIFEGTRKPLVVWFRTIWWVVSQKNGASALGLKRVLGLGFTKLDEPWSDRDVIDCLEGLRLTKLIGVALKKVLEAERL